MEQTEAISSMDEVLTLFENWLSDQHVRVTLEWGEDTLLFLCAYEGQFDYCDIGEGGPDIPRSFDFFFASGPKESHQVSIPFLDEEDVEVNLEEDAIEISSGLFFLRLVRVNPS